VWVTQAGMLKCVNFTVNQRDFDFSPGSEEKPARAAELRD